MRRQLVGSGNNTVKVNLSSGGSDYSIYDEASIPYGIPTVSSATVRKILALDNVENVTCYNSRFVSEGVYYQNQPLTEFYIYGIDDRYFDTVGYKLKSGRNFHKEDSADFRKVVILDQTAANNLFQEENPLGKTVEINSQPFTVIGIVYSSVAYDPDIQNIEDYYTYEDGSNGLFFIPKASWPIIFTYDEPENVIVKATSTEDMTKAGQRTANILNATITAQEPTVTYAAQDLLGIVDYRPGTDRHLCGAGPSRHCKTAAGAGECLQHAADLDRRDFPSGRRYRRHEYHAGVRDGANQ